MKYIANWTIDGFKGKRLEAGAIIEAYPEEVADFVQKDLGGRVTLPGAAALTPIKEKPGAAVPKPTSPIAGEEAVPQP